MTDRIIERQAIRAALALAVASAHGQAVDGIADMRDEAAQLIGLCVGEFAPDEVRQWCDDASSLVERLSSDGTLPRRAALSASAAILRLRLAVARKPVPAVSDNPDTPARASKKKIVRAAAPSVKVGGNQKVVLEYIAGHPDARTKDIIDSFNGSLSSRTIKRCLKDLSDAGVVKRIRQDDRSVLYRVDSQ